jgi:predicted phage terminase large subunit-like protein
MWELCCSEHKFVAIAAPRGHAKSTAISLSYTLAALLFRERSYVLLISDSEAQAAMFLGAIKQELTENEDIIDLFGLPRDEKGIVKFTKESETDIIVQLNDGYTFRVQARGSEQRLRGLLWNGKRPDLIVLDDLENDEIVMNKDRREKFRRWFYGALLPARSKDGIVRYVGTILHMDAMLERLMPEFQLQTKNKETFMVREELKEYTNHRLPWKSVKYFAHNDDFSKILWPEKWSKEELLQERQKYVDQGMSDVYSQEFLNKPIDDALAYFKKVDFRPITQEDRKKRLNYYIAGDFAISQKEKADWTAAVIGGVDEEGYLHVKNVIRERLDGREIVDLLIQLQKMYKPIFVGIEDGQITQSIGPFLREEMMKQNEYLNIIRLKPHKTDKILRSRSIQARMRAGSVKFDKEAEWYPTLEDEMVKFPRGRNDDQVDAISYLGLMIDQYIPALTDAEVAEEEYLDEYEKANQFNDGRSQVTGY